MGGGPAGGGTVGGGALTGAALTGGRPEPAGGPATAAPLGLPADPALFASTDGGHAGNAAAGAADGGCAAPDGLPNPGGFAGPGPKLDGFAGPGPKLDG